MTDNASHFTSKGQRVAKDLLVLDFSSIFQYNNTGELLNLLSSSNQLDKSTVFDTDACERALVKQQQQLAQTTNRLQAEKYAVLFFKQFTYQDTFVHNAVSTRSYSHGTLSRKSDQPSKSTPNF